jgi:hypothetical protein
MHYTSPPGFFLWESATMNFWNEATRGNKYGCKTHVSWLDYHQGPNPDLLAAGV